MKGLMKKKGHAWSNWYLYCPVLRRVTATCLLSLYDWGTVGETQSLTQRLSRCTVLSQVYICFGFCDCSLTIYCRKIRHTHSGHRSTPALVPWLLTNYFYVGLRYRNPKAWSQLIRSTVWVLITKHTVFCLGQVIKGPENLNALCARLGPS